ncbi:MAG: TlyA family RNA methyltransferase [Sphaerochaetaceae bacterium]
MKLEPLINLLEKEFPNYNKDQLKAFVDCREVKVDGETAVDYKQLFSSNSEVEIIHQKYVSRGGEKLEHALKSWSLNVNNLIFVDAGSSTGGFSDALLQHGAKLVHAVDVGYNQLDYKLRTNPKVVVHERTNIMRVKTLNPTPDAAVADLSFRSIVNAADHILSLTKQKWMVALIKPQFELDDKRIEFTGVVEDKALLIKILKEVARKLTLEGVEIEKDSGFSNKGEKRESRIFSPFKTKREFNQFKRD